MAPADLAPVELLEVVLISFILAGVLWNSIVVDHVRADLIPVAIVATTGLLTWVLSFDGGDARLQMHLDR